MDHNAAANKRLERTRHERASLVSCVGEPLKRNVGRFVGRELLGRECCLIRHESIASKQHSAPSASAKLVGDVQLRVIRFGHIHRVSSLV